MARAAHRAKFFKIQKSLSVFSTPVKHGAILQLRTSGRSVALFSEPWSGTLFFSLLGTMRLVFQGDAFGNGQYQGL
jgi:hypothetical protein